MAISQMLQRVYASAPVDALLIQSLRIYGVGFESLNLVHGYSETVLQGVAHEPCQITFSLPEKSTTGNQKLKFAIGLVDSRAQRIAESAIESNSIVYLTYTEYLASNMNAPARPPITMVVVGGDFPNNATVQIEAQYFDMLNLAWPRERYTVDKAPGVKYI